VVNADNPVIELVKIPVPVASVVLASAMVGFGEVLQHTPRSVTEVYPSEVTFPPAVAEVAITALAAVVVKVGIVVMAKFSVLL